MIFESIDDSKSNVKTSAVNENTESKKPQVSMSSSDSEFDNFGEIDLFELVDYIDNLAESRERKIDQTKMKKIISLIKNPSTGKKTLASIEISPDSVAKIISPSSYTPEDITDLVKIINSSSRKSGENLNYDEDYTKDARDNRAVIFSIFLNTIICKKHKHNKSKVLYCPEPIEILEDKNREDNVAREKFQKRISSHMFESVEKVRKIEKPNFIFIPYKISIYDENNKQYAHELLLVFDISKQKNEDGYIKYFDSSHFTQTIPSEKIKTVFPSPPFPDGFSLEKSGLINRDKTDIFQIQEGSMSCTYWVEAFVLTMLEMDEESIKGVIEGQLDASFKKRIENKFKELRKTQFKNQQQTAPNITNPIDIFRQHNIRILPEETPNFPQDPRRVPTERRRFNESKKNRYQPTPKEATLRTRVRHRKPSDFKQRNPKKFSPGCPGFH